MMSKTPRLKYSPTWHRQFESGARKMSGILAFTRDAAMVLLAAGFWGKMEGELGVGKLSLIHI